MEKRKGGERFITFPSVSLFHTGWFIVAPESEMHSGLPHPGLSIYSQWVRPVLPSSAQKSLHTVKKTGGEESEKKEKRRLHCNMSDRETSSHWPLTLLILTATKQPGRPPPPKPPVLRCLPPPRRSMPSWAPRTRAWSCHSKCRSTRGWSRGRRT